MEPVRTAGPGGTYNVTVNPGQAVRLWIQYQFGLGRPASAEETDDWSAIALAPTGTGPFAQARQALQLRMPGEA